MGVLFNDVVINKLSGGLGRRTPNQDMVSGLLFNTPVQPDAKIEKDKIYRLASVKDAEDLGIDENYDKDGISVYYQISQFFRMNPSGDLFIMRHEETKPSYASLVANGAELMLDQANGAIRQLAIVSQVGKAGDFSGTIAAIGEAKTVTEKAFKDFRPVEILLEGKGFDLAKPYDLKESGAENVSVTIAMDQELVDQGRYFVADENGNKSTLYAFSQDEVLRATGVKNGEFNVFVKNSEGDETPVTAADGSTPIVLISDDSYKNTAAVGVLLGAVSKAKVSENIAWVEKFNLTGSGFRTVGFVGGVSVRESETKTLDEFKYIFSRKHIGLPGVYFNDSHTCTVSTSDFTFIEANRTINKAARIARTALLPKLNSPVLVDPDSGKLAPSVVKGFETLCRSAVERMISNEEVSEIDVYVNPNQDILANSELEIEMSIVPMGTARRIIVNLGFKNPFQLNASVSAPAASAPAPTT